MIFTAATEWTCPETFPDLSQAKYIAIDLETKDPNLKSRGSGAVIGEGEIIGCLLYTSPSPRDGLLSRMPSSA